jgi:hypothetical protein
MIALINHFCLARPEKIWIDIFFFLVNIALCNIFFQPGYIQIAVLLWLIFPEQIQSII